MKIQAIVLDWAGTTVDYGSRAPVSVLLEVMRSYDVAITLEEARTYMGLPKLDHIRATCALPSVRQRWIERHRAAPDEQAVQRLYADFTPRQLACLEDYSGLIPGVVKAIDRFRARGIRIGSSTGYTRPMLEVLLDRAARQGYRPDASVVPDEAGEGRPAPYMCYLNAMKLRVYPLSACVKIGDTPSDIAEGRNAGMWTIGVALTGNEVGLTPDEYTSLSPEEQRTKLQAARERLLAAGADFVADSLAECDPSLDEIERRMA